MPSHETKGMYLVVSLNFVDVENKSDLYSHIGSCCPTLCLKGFSATTKDTRITLLDWKACL